MGPARQTGARQASIELRRRVGIIYGFRNGTFGTHVKAEARGLLGSIYRPWNDSGTNFSKCPIGK